MTKGSLNKWPFYQCLNKNTRHIDILSQNMHACSLFYHRNINSRIRPNQKGNSKRTVSSNSYTRGRSYYRNPEMLEHKAEKPNNKMSLFGNTKAKTFSRKQWQPLAIYVTEMQHTGKLLLLRAEFLPCKRKARSRLLQGSTLVRHDF